MEIKFRGLRIDGGEWIYGHYLVVNDRHIIVPAKVNIRFNCDFILPENLGYGFGELEQCGDGFPVEVIPETVGQYTGLKDKNGVEIYDGDICKRGQEVVVIEFRNSMWIKQNIVTGDILWLNANFPISSYKKIGNIHQNPELLGEK